jgi:AmmeMemoRadiSam system protein A/AmmeMemoRadiSam system protein B
MGSQGSIVFSGVAPHPPIMVPEVGREAVRDVRRSIEAMEEMTNRVIKSGAETLVLISPHAPLEPQAFVAYAGSIVYGNFSHFRAPKTFVEAPVDHRLLEALSTKAALEGFVIAPLDDSHLDHGTAVPLYFLQRNGWTGRVVALGYSFLSNSDHLRFGRCIAKAAEAVGYPVAFIASGDLSHRLKPDAPAGYDPSAHLFDEEVVEAIQTNEPHRIAEIDQDLRRIAGECGYRSLLVAIGAISDQRAAGEVLSYEAPFGVGYLVAQITGERHIETQNENRSTNESDANELLPRLAREVVETYVRTGQRLEPQIDHPYIAQRAACFVSLKTEEGELRGCIGTIQPAEQTLAEEIVSNAIGSATRDPRFPPVAENELADLRYSVDVLSPAEPARFEDLDPRVYGVIVEDASGLQRGLLLPDIEGVDTEEQQVQIAARKAGIRFESPLTLFRFRVERFREPF